MHPHMEEESVVKCPECSSRNLFNDLSKGELCCEDCGLVVEENIVDQGAEWRVFSANDGLESVRTGAPASVLFHDKGLSTDIEWSNRDFAGKSISTKNRGQLYRMRKWQRRARISSSFDRNMSSALAEITRLGAQMGLSKTVQEEAAVIYRKALENDLIRGRSIDAMVAASLYLANQKLRTARSLDDFEKASKVKRKALTRAHKTMKMRLKLRIDPAVPEEYVDRYVNLLGLHPSIISDAIALIQTARGRELIHGKSPTGVAAAAIYIVARQSTQLRTQREIADISGVTEVTIRNRYKELCSALGIELE